MTHARLDDRALLDTLDWDDPVAASDTLARAVDPDGRSLARRDAALLAIHRERFGEVLRCAGQCPSCGTALELELPLTELIPASVPETGLRIVHDGIEIEYRLPSRVDLLAVADERTLAERCVIAARRVADGAAIDAASLPMSALARMGEAMAELHPAAGLLVDVTCEVCGGRWDAGLDVARFVAARARVDAMRVIAEVHALAGAYGWTEAEVLAVPRPRRRRYLELVLA
jgi:hypothetical protein